MISGNAAARARAAVAALLLVPLMACEGTVRGPGMTTSEISTAELDRDIFLPSCAFGACHGGQKPAAMLDLAHGLCGARIDQASCLFPGKRLVVPGHPEQSFLIDKLTGENLGSPPQTACSTTGNVRMPLGGVALSAESIQRVRVWISGGAVCPGRDGTDAIPATQNADGGTNGGGPSIATDAGGSLQLSLAIPATRLRAGERMSLTLTITPPAGSAGASAAMDVDDPSVLGTPAAVFIPPGASQATFEVQGKRPARQVTLAASVGAARANAALTIDGLFIAEVFYGKETLPSPGDRSQWVKLVNIADVPIDLGDYLIGAGRTSYAETTVRLSGVLGAGSCLVIGGPTSAATNGAPVFGQVHDFDPDVPRVDANQPAVGVALFPGVTNAAPTNPAATIPIDTVVAGGGNAGSLLGPDGQPAVRVVTAVPAGHTLRRLGATSWADQAIPAPAECPRW